MNGTRTPVLFAAAAGCVLAPGLMLAGVESPLRVVAALLLFGVAPGAAALPLIAQRRPAPELALVLGFSLSVSAVTAQLMLTLALWSPMAGTCLLAAICLTSILRQLQALRPRPSAAGA